MDDAFQARRGAAMLLLTSGVGLTRRAGSFLGTELKHDRRIRDSGKRRHNVSGCRAIVWVAVVNQEQAA